MNSEQLQDWLTDLNERWKSNVEKRTLKNVDYERTQLTRETYKTHYLINYLSCNYTDVDLVQPVVAQLLACYYRGGTLRYFVLQCIPSLIHIYFLALAKRQKKSVSMFETFFLAMYNEEILASGVSSESVAKKIEEFVETLIWSNIHFDMARQQIISDTFVPDVVVFEPVLLVIGYLASQIRIPSVYFPSVYHDPTKLNLTSDIALKPGAAAFVQKIVRIGPYKSVDRIIPQNRQTVLTRLLKSVNGCLCMLSRDVICQGICLSTIALCRSGFSFRQAVLGSRVFGSSFRSKEFDDFSKKPRLRISSQYLLESLNGLYFALFNGAPELAVQAIDAVHQRAIYEFYADVVLVTNSITETLLENNLQKNDELLTFHWTRPGKLDSHKGNEVVTNASLRLKKMPEDISPVIDNDTKGFNFSDSVENFKKQIAVKVEQRKLKRQLEYRRRKSENNESTDDIELGPVGEVPISNAAPSSLVSQEVAHQDLLRNHCISYGSSNSDNNVSVSFQQDQVRNGRLPEPRNELIDYSISTPADLPETAKSETGLYDLVKWPNNIQHIDSTTDTFEGTSL